MLANHCMDEERKVYFSEVEQMGEGVEVSKAAEPNRV